VSAVVDGSLTRFTDHQRRVGYVDTYVPENAKDQSRLKVEAGREATADFRIRPSELIRVTGSLRNARGIAATEGFVRVGKSTRAGAIVFGLPAGAVRVKSNGTFAMDLAVNTKYILIGSTASPWLQPGLQRETELGETWVALKAHDVSGIEVNTNPGMTVAGEVVFDGSAPNTADELVDLRVMPLAYKPEDVNIGPPASAQIDSDHKFELKNVFCHSFIHAVPPAGSRWQLKAVYLNGADITTKGVEFAAGRRIDGVKVVLTDERLR
jgi:hypothetical protein